MSVSKRSWSSPNGEEKSAWVCRYADAQGKRRLKTFDRKKDADAFAATASVEVRQGVHVADRASVTVKQAGAFWIASGEASGLERSTINQRKRHLTQHIEPFIGPQLLARLGAPAVREFEDTLRREERSSAMVRKVVGSLGSIFADAVERGLATRNPVRDMRGRRKGAERRQEKRHRARLKVGTDIPTRQEVKALVEALSGRWRPLLLTAIFTGLRSSELRGLRWQDVDLEKRSVSVHQRADEFGEIGRPKSEAGERTIPIPPLIVAALREWRLACPQRDTGRRDGAGEPVKELHFVFPNGAGRTESHANIINRGLVPAMARAGVTIDTGRLDNNGEPILAAKYSGLHALRHFYASWLINRPQDGGLGLPLKVVQERMGHSSVTMTADTYGHLFPRGDDADELALAERALLG